MPQRYNIFPPCREARRYHTHQGPERPVRLPFLVLPDHRAPLHPPGPAPATVVQEYFAAINQGKYAKAWRLGGSNFSPSYAAFVARLQGTVNDVVLSARGRVVTAHLAALQADGTTKVYDGTYTVINGAIARSSVHQVS